jgi:serine/threonine-protein kinase RsbW
VPDQPTPVTATTAGAPSPAVTHDRVEIRLPTDSAYLTVLRTATAAVAARLDFTLDDIEDLRIAVDEACALLLRHADPAGELLCTFDVGEATLDIRMSVPAIAPRLPARDTFAWTVLSALAGHVDAGVEPAGDGSPDETAWIVLRKPRSTR